MDSHAYADVLAEVAEGLRQRPAFELPNYTREIHLRLQYFSDKDRFLRAARAIGSGTKTVNDSAGEYKFTAAFGPLTIVADRTAVCRIVKPAQPAEYECEPLLEQEEEAGIGADAGVQ